MTVEAHDLARDLARRATGSDERAWAEGARTVDALDGRDWLVLDQAARTYRSGTTPVSGVRDWLGESFDEPTGFVAAVTSLHVDGRFRERAVHALAVLDPDLATRALAVRLLDHVPPIRDAARSALRGRLGPRSLELALDVVLAGKDRAHAGEAIALLGEHALEGGGDGATIDHLLASEVRRVRRWAFLTAHRLGRLDETTLLQAAVRDADQWVQATSASWLMQSTDPANLLPLLDATSVEARLVAVTRVPADMLDRSSLERLLVDRAPRVREQARWRARRLGVDHTSAYRTMLGASGPPRVRAAALEALASLGDASDHDAMRAALDDPHPRVRAAGVTAVVARLDRAETLTLLVPLLEDPSARVSSTAARALVQLGVAPDVAERAWGSDRPATRRAAWRVARSGGAWHRVEADLRAAGDADPQLARLGEAGVRNWLAVGAVTTYATISAQQQARIAGHLEASTLDPGARRIVAFHSGIRVDPVFHRP